MAYEVDRMANTVAHQHFRFIWHTSAYVSKDRRMALMNQNAGSEVDAILSEDFPKNRKYGYILNPFSFKRLSNSFFFSESGM